MRNFKERNSQNTIFKGNGILKGNGHLKLVPENPKHIVIKYLIIVLKSLIIFNEC